LICPTFTNFARLSGLVPLVGLVAGYAFAGNAAILGTCDVTIAVEGCSVGMSGPLMIEGAGLGKIHPSEIGPCDSQSANGVLDIVVKNEAEAVAMAKKYLSYFQGTAPLHKRTGCVDQQLLRGQIPENRKRVYEMSSIIDILADIGSVLYLRLNFGIGVYTALARIDGRPIGIIASNPKHLGGALDADAAMKAARFLELCDAFDLPIVSLCDCPGFMVGKESEREATVRKFCKMYVVGASITVPFFTVVTRKAYGLGTQAMSGGKQMGQNFCISWPTGEFGGMGLEGHVRLGFSKELADAHAKGGEKAELELFEKLLNEFLDVGKALNNAKYLEIDDVIDPAKTRDCIIAGLQQNPEVSISRKQKKRSCISTW
jgi:acetyl-CoA carboxylase carboxyltransferase component